MKKLLLTSALILGIACQLKSQCGTVTPIPTTNLLAYYPLNSAQGNDLSGNHNDLSMNTAGIFTSSDKFGTNMMATLTSGGFIGSLTNNTNLNLSNQFTASVWFNTNNASLSQRLIDKTSVGSSNNYMIDLQAGKVRAIIAGVVVNSTTNILTGTWYHAAVTYDGANVKLYINGVLETTTPNTTSFVNNTLPILLGKDHNGSSNYNGIMDEVRIYKQALTAPEIQSIYNGPFLYSSPSGYHSCSSGNSYTLTASQGGSNQTFQWQKNNIDIPGEINNTLIIPAISPADTGYYTCKLRSNCYEITTSQAHISYGPQLIPTQGLFAHYTFSNGSGADETNYHHDLKGMHPTNTTAGPDHLSHAQEGLAIGGNVGRADNKTTMNLSNTFTFSGWINSSNAMASQRIIDKSPIGGSNNYMIDLQSGHVRAIIAGATVQTTQTLASNTWYHIVVTHDGANINIYVNNILAATIANTGGFTNNAQALCLGYDVMGGNNFNGAFDEFRLYNRALTVSEINALYYDLTIYNKAATYYTCGNNITLTANTMGSPGSTFQWYKNGSPISGANSINLTLSNTTVADQGTYYFTYDYNCIRNISKPIQVWYGNAIVNESGLLLNLPTQNNDWTNKSEIPLVFTPISGAVASTNAYGSTSSAISNANGIGIVPNSTALNLTNSFTYSGWIYANYAYPDQRIIDKTTAGNNSNYLIDMHLQQVRVIAAGATLTSLATIQNKQWYYITTTYDGSVLKLYLNGKLDTSVINTTSFTNNALNLAFGLDQTNGNIFDGAMSSMRLYNRALSATEIEVLATIEKPAFMIGSLNDLTFCPGSTIIQSYYADNTGNTQWYNNNTPINPASPAPLTINNAGSNDAGNYFVELTSNFNSCIKTQSNIFVATANDTTIISTITQNGNTLTADQGGTGYTYQWYSAGFNPESSTTQSFTPNLNGTYFVMITEPLCAHSAYSQSVTINSIGLKENQNNYFNIYPNPAQDVLYVNTNTEINIEVYSIEGKLIKSNLLTANQNKLNIEDLNPGFYSIRIESKGNISFIKFVKQ